MGKETYRNFSALYMRGAGSAVRKRGKHSKTKTSVGWRKDRENDRFVFQGDYSQEMGQTIKKKLLFSQTSCGKPNCRFGSYAM